MGPQGPWKGNIIRGNKWRSPDWSVCAWGNTVAVFINLTRFQLTILFILRYKTILPLEWNYQQSFFLNWGRGGGGGLGVILIPLQMCFFTRLMPCLPHKCVVVLPLPAQTSVCLIHMKSVLVVRHWSSSMASWPHKWHSQEYHHPTPHCHICSIHQCHTNIVFTYRPHVSGLIIANI